MTYMTKSVEELHELLIKGETSPQELLDEAWRNSREIQERYNAFVTVTDKAEETEVTDHVLSGIPYGAEDLYSTKPVRSWPERQLWENPRRSEIRGIRKEVLPVRHARLLQVPSRLPWLLTPVIPSAGQRLTAASSDTSRRMA